jgi:two-component system LytT family response regulator
MNTYRIVIVDDEINNILILRHFISKYCLNVEIVGQAVSISEAIVVINRTKPDILFLDIRINEGEIFDALDKLDITKAQVIFVTAHDEYAVKAFKYNAIDYILKPISIEEVVIAVNKAIMKIEQQNFFDFRTMSTINKDISESKEYVAVASIDKIDLLQSNEIMYIEAGGKYSIFHTRDGKQYTSSKNLGNYEKVLDDACFFRIHHTYIINMKYVVRVIKKDGSYCELMNGLLIPVAKRKQDDFNRFLKIKE